MFYGCMNDTFCCGRLLAVAGDELDICTGLCEKTGLWMLFIYLDEPLHVCIIETHAPSSEAVQGGRGLWW